MELAAAITAFLAPFLPHLLKLGQPVAEAAGKKLGEKFGEGTWDRAKALWSKLRPQVEAKEAAKEATEDVANAPDDEALQTVLRVQLEKLLGKDDTLAKELAQLLQDQAEGGKNQTVINQTAIGEDAQQFGQVQGSNKVVRDVQGDVTM